MAGLQAAFRAISGLESTLAVVASTLAIAALFGPLRRWVQALGDRRKYDAASTTPQGPLRPSAPGFETSRGWTP